VDMKLEVVVVPAHDVDLAKDFYRALGWRLDADLGAGADFRLVQVTPPDSTHSVVFTSAAPSPTQVPRSFATGTDATTYGSAGALAEALRRAAAAHGEHEKEIGQPDPDWPDWCARYMVDEQACRHLPAFLQNSGGITL
jgi:catechol 2,3-dioxygenase-like lactoylglutathione lyase family enzyme